VIKRGQILYRKDWKKIEEVLFRSYEMRYRGLAKDGRNLGYDFFKNRLVQEAQAAKKTAKTAF
jgi:hypothetical protein